MRCLFLICLIILTFPVAVLAQPAPPAMPVATVAKERLPDPNAPVAVELFTTQSCPFCPQAEAMFQAMVEKPNIIGITCPVDFFHMGDQLAQGFCIDRQAWYRDRLNGGPSYTPQIIVNGFRQAAGSHTERVGGLIAQAQADGTQPIQIDPLDADAYHIILPDTQTKANLDGWVLTVITFRKPVETTDKFGTSVTYARIADRMQNIPLTSFKGSDFKLTVPLSDQQQGFVVFLQKQDTGAITAAGQFAKK